MLVTGAATISVQAEDPDGDKLTFSWKASLGQLDASEGEGPIAWTAPAERGTATIGVSVEDGRGGKAEASVDVGILSWVQSSAAGTVEPGLPFQSVSFAGPDDGWIVGGAEGNLNTPHIYHYAGGSWTKETQDEQGHLTTVVALAPDNVWTAGGGGLAYHWDGANWKKFTLPGGCVHGLAFLGAVDGWATPAEGQPYMRRYSGGAVTAWKQYPAPQSSGIHAVSMIGPDSGFAVGNKGMLLGFDGTKWSKQDSPVSGSLYGVHMVGPDAGWIVGSTGAVLRWDGTAWAEVEAPQNPGLQAVHAIGADFAVAVGKQGRILLWNGQSFAELPSPVSSILRSVFLVSETDGWIVGDNSTILHLE